MVHVLVVTLCAVILIAIVNWLFFDKFVAKLFFVLIIILRSVSFFLFPVQQRWYEISATLATAIAFLFVFPLLFFATTYIYYLKNKDDIKAIKKTFFEAIFYIIIMFLSSGVVVYYYLYFFDYL